MLSHQQGGGTTQEEYRKHRRQTSTPTTVEAFRIPTAPAPALQEFQKTHRRGQSLDQRPLRARQSQTTPGRLAPTNATVAYTTPSPHHLQYHHQDLALQRVPDFSTLATLSVFAQDAYPLNNDLQSISHLNNNAKSSPSTTPNTARGGNTSIDHEPLQLSLNRIQQQQQPNSSDQSYASVQHALPGTPWVCEQDGLTVVQHQARDSSHQVRRPSVESNVSQKVQPRTPVFWSNDSKCFKPGTLKLAC